MTVSIRVTSLADALKLNFALITTDRRRANYDALSSKFHSTRHSPAESIHGDQEDLNPSICAVRSDGPTFVDGECSDNTGMISVNYTGNSEHLIQVADLTEVPAPASTTSTEYNFHVPPHPGEDYDDEYTDDNAREVTYGRLVHGHVVDDDYPSVPASVRDDDEDPNTAPTNLVNSIYSITSSNDHALGGAVDTNETDDEEEVNVASAQERMITLVGHVRDKTVLIVDDMIDRPGSWIAAAEHCVKRAGANKVYCIATHGVFGGECLEEMEDCSYIDYVCAHFRFQSLMLIVCY